jgi:putative IMPACT (imprinted ancient) family translation regulator
LTEVLDDGTTVLKHDNDDDGEDAAGARLAHLLEMRKEDCIFVVVSRWYGGIKLGPKRFAHINNVARELLQNCYDQNLLNKTSNDNGDQKR